MAMSYFRRRKFDECIEVCSRLLTKNPYDQVTVTVTFNEKLDFHTIHVFYIREPLIRNIVLQPVKNKTFTSPTVVRNFQKAIHICIFEFSEITFPFEFAFKFLSNL